MDGVTEFRLLVAAAYMDREITPIEREFLVRYAKSRELSLSQANQVLTEVTAGEAIPMPRNVPSGARDRLMRALTRMLVCDGSLKKSEQLFLLRVGDKLGLTAAQVREVLGEISDRHLGRTPDER